MRKLVLAALVFTTTMIGNKGFSQLNLAFGVTAAQVGRPWNIIEEIDLSSGEMVKNFYNPFIDKDVLLSNVILDPDDRFNSDRLLPMGQGVAAAAYDAKHNRLYYTSTRGVDLRYFYVGSERKTIVINNDKQLNTGDKLKEANIITRMTFCSDGYGYELTNDGNHLIRFTTDENCIVTDLGPLVDGKANGVSVHAEKNWGGDIIGDAYGNMYLVTFHKSVFKINLQTMVTDFVGQIKGLPGKFTCSGAVADVNGELIIGSVSEFDNYYKVNMATLQALPLARKNGTIHITSDLASAYMLDPNKTAGPDILVTNVNKDILIYPNPAIGRSVNIKFKGALSGQYKLAFLDIANNVIFTKCLMNIEAGRMEQIMLPATLPAGEYLLTLKDSSNKSIFCGKVILV